MGHVSWFGGASLPNLMELLVPGLAGSEVGDRRWEGVDHAARSERKVARMGSLLAGREAIHMVGIFHIK